MLKEILSWFSRNRLKTLTGTALLAGTSYWFVGSNSTNPLASPPKYSVSLDTCAVQPGSGGVLDTLSFKLLLCNDGSRTLTNARIKVDSARVVMCSVNSVKFIVVRAKDESGETVPLDSLSYPNVPVNTECKPPAEEENLRLFKFCAPMLEHLAPATDSVCVRLAMKIYHSTNIKDVRPMHIIVPMRQLHPIISMAENLNAPR